VSQYKTLADALESEVLTEMAGTFFGARKAVDDLLDDFNTHVEQLRGLSDRVYERVFFLRALLLGQEGENALFAALDLPPQFPETPSPEALPAWRPNALPFAFLPSSRYAKAVLLAYGEVCRACEAYLVGEYEDDPERKGRKRMSLHYGLVERLARRVNERIDKLNTDMAPSLVLQYARNISNDEQSGQGAITNALGAESLDKGLMIKTVDFAGLGIWKAPHLPPLADCEEKLKAFAQKYYKAHTDEIRRVMAELAPL